MEEVTNINIRNIPTETRNQFKAICSFRGTDMKTEIIKLMKKEVEAAKNDPVQKDLFR